MRSAKLQKYLLTGYKDRNENVKVNVCIETTAENERSLQSEEKMSNQSVTIAVCQLQNQMFLHCISHFTCCRVRTFAFRILYA